MSISTLTSKGQVTIPKDLRRRLRLRAGDKLDFRAEQDGSLRVYPVARTVAEVFGAFSDKASRRHSTTEIRERLKSAFREGRL
ncbi:MAG: AbrB/MazE/SpoVT family DNA-binding domain-containing protein [bacterium]|nr:AbrB/MazE/SpoVT family DNA-binding domain-containing protein [bacterium]